MARPGVRGRCVCEAKRDYEFVYVHTVNGTAAEMLQRRYVLFAEVRCAAGAWRVRIPLVLTMPQQRHVRDGERHHEICLKRTE